MPTTKRTCQICGKEYDYCKTYAPTGKFRWQDVACCPEHAQEYFRLVAIARGEIPEDKPVSETEVADKSEEETVEK